MRHPASVTEDMARAFQAERVKWRVEWCFGAWTVKHIIRTNGLYEVNVCAFADRDEADRFCDLTATMVGIAAAVKLADGWDAAAASVTNRPLPDAEMRSRMKTPVELP